jgi:hypothetical protein
MFTADFNSYYTGIVNYAAEYNNQYLHVGHSKCETVIAFYRHSVSQYVIKAYRSRQKEEFIMKY